MLAIHSNNLLYKIIITVIFEHSKTLNLQRLKIENFKIRILFRTPRYKSFDKKIFSEYIFSFLMT